jgi:cytochrome c oxidase assembly protein subunit 15
MAPSDSPHASPSSRWERRARVGALGAWLAAFPLVLFGGSVTTLGAGMAVDGWLIAEGHFLVFFPVEEWLRDTATFVEHTHRLCGVAVGLFALLTLLSAWLAHLARAERLLATAGFVAVCAQGALGGLRVLENSPSLAFVHGALAQAVFAILAAGALVLSPRFQRAQRAPDAAALDLARVRRRAWIAAAVVYGQIVLGAMYRHALRSEAGAVAGAGAPAAVFGRFVLHAGGALVALLAVLALAGALVEAEGGGRTSVLAPCARARKRLFALLGLQLALGVLAWTSYRPDALGPLEWGVSILHVLVGGLLLAECVTSALWAARLGRRDEQQHISPALEGALRS